MLSGFSRDLADQSSEMLLFFVCQNTCGSVLSLFSNSFSLISGPTRIVMRGTCASGPFEEAGVGVREILLQIDREIAQLKSARALLKGGASTNRFHLNGASRNGRNKNHHLTPEGRRRIAEAQKRRWEKERKAAAGK